MRALHFFILALLIGCSSPPEITREEIHQQHPQLSVMDDASFYYQAWKGTPYQYGGSTKNGIDCSAFTQNFYEQIYQYPLSRTTLDQAQEGRSVALNEIKKGDLVFFKTGTKVRHVGIYVGNREFMHASTSKGVIISSLDNPYWKKSYWQVRRYINMNE